MEHKVFAQLYSIVRQEREGHLAALRALSEIGYDGVELLGNNTNGLDYEGYRDLLRELGLRVLSSHNLHTEEDYAFAAGLGAKYDVLPGCDALRDRGELERVCEGWNETGRKLSEYGMKAVIHNHGEEFCKLDAAEDSERIYDFLLRNTDPALVGFELDVGWAVRAGVDPVAYLRGHAGRFPLIHVKECDSVADSFEALEHFPHRVLEMGEPSIVNGVPYFSEAQKRLLDESRRWNVALGTGIVNFPAIVAAAEEQGCEAYISERESYFLSEVPDGDPVKCAALDYRYLRAL